MAVKATDAADATRSTTGSIPVWSEDYKKALERLPEVPLHRLLPAEPHHRRQREVRRRLHPAREAAEGDGQGRLRLPGRVVEEGEGQLPQPPTSGGSSRPGEGSSPSPTCASRRTSGASSVPCASRCRVQQVAAGTQHFLIQPSKAAGTAQVAGGITQLFKGNLSPQAAFNPGTAAGELQRLNRITPTPIQFPAGSAAVPAADQAKLDFMATYLKRIHNPPVHGDDRRPRQRRGLQARERKPRRQAARGRPLRDSRRRGVTGPHVVACRRPRPDRLSQRATRPGRRPSSPRRSPPAGRTARRSADPRVRPHARAGRRVRRAGDAHGQPPRPTKARSARRTPTRSPSAATPTTPASWRAATTSASSISPCGPPCRRRAKAAVPTRRCSARPTGSSSG